MLDLLKITLVFVTMLVLLRLKWNIGYVMLIASALVFLLYLSPPELVFSTIKTMLTDTVTIKLFFSLTLIRALEMVLREKQVLAKMTEASRSLFKRKKAVIISMPMLIGLLPSLGGAYFSAPMVEEATRGLNLPAGEKGFINYWFRHPWEMISPLYPGVLLASALTNIELRNIILANIPCSLMLLIAGFLFSMRGIKGSFTASLQPSEGGAQTMSAWRSYLGFLPITAILLLVVLFHVELHYALGLVIAVLFVFYRYRPKEILKVLRYGFAIEVIVLIFGVMLFKFAMESSGAVRHLDRYFIESGIPILSVLFVLPFLTGLLTGLTVGFVGGTFPLLISLTGGIQLTQLSFAFVSGYLGVLLSPVHLCFILTREYFNADMWGMYKKTLPACGIIMAGALVGYLLLK